MIRASLLLLVLVQTTFADDFLKQLTPKDLSPDQTAQLNQKLTQMAKLYQNQPAQCAMPLKEVKVADANRMDPIALPTSRGAFESVPVYKTLDKGIEHSVPIPACPSR
jgi:hypothetical protein